MTDSRVAAADRKSFGQSFGLPRATLGPKATPLAEIVTRVSESSWTANGYLDQARAVLAATSAIFYTPLKRELIGRLWHARVNRGTRDYGLLARDHPGARFLPAPAKPLGS
jgi:hypothetical protein